MSLKLFAFLVLARIAFAEGSVVQNIRTFVLSANGEAVSEHKIAFGSKETINLDTTQEVKVRSSVETALC